VVLALSDSFFDVSRATPDDNRNPIKNIINKIQPCDNIFLEDGAIISSLSTYNIK